MHEAALLLVDQRLHLGEMIGPARGADHVAALRGECRADVAQHGVRPREVDAHGYVGGVRNPSTHDDRLVSALVQDRLDLAAHVAVADDGDLHAGWPSKNS